MTVDFVVGVDPGVDGAWVAIGADGQAAAGYGWARSAGRLKRAGKRHEYTITGRDGMALPEPSLWAPAVYLREFMHDRVVALVIEGLFGRGRGVQSPAEVAGLFIHAAAGSASDITLDAWRPRASKWRPEVLGCPGATPSDRVDELTVEWCGRQGLDLGALADNPHAREAACMAAYGWSLVRGAR